MATLPFESDPSDTPERIVLLVDDNPTNLEVLFEALSHFGFRLLVAEDGESALEQVLYIQPDMILLDVMMPGIDGFETCRRLKAQPQTADIPIIFMTALTETIDKVTGFKLGAVDYITKPIQPDEVLARVNTHLTLRDLRYQLQQQNEQLHQEIQERQVVEDKLRLLLHSVSHDLRNPVTGMSIVLNTLIQQDPITLSQAVAQRMQQSCERQLHLINSLVESEAAERWGITLQTRPYPLDQLVQQVIQDWELKIQQQQATVINQVSPLPPVLIDCFQLWRVFDNVMSNALKYNSAGLTITIGGRLDSPTWVLCWIEDNGVGMSPEQVAQLFQRYSRGANARYTSGLGLGLYLCQQIIQAHGGEVGVESQLDQGTRFWFTLPVATQPTSQT